MELAGKYAVKDMSVEEPQIEAIVRDIYEKKDTADGHH